MSLFPCFNDITMLLFPRIPKILSVYLKLSSTSSATLLRNLRKKANYYSDY